MGCNRETARERKSERANEKQMERDGAPTNQWDDKESISATYPRERKRRGSHTLQSIYRRNMVSAYGTGTRKNRT